MGVGQADACAGSTLEADPQHDKVGSSYKSTKMALSANMHDWKVLSYYFFQIPRPPQVVPILAQARAVIVHHPGG